ncbi:MAG: glycosyltransferase [Fibrella sp.]|nr:glycosyltransferase [Armatimonadota bacterium]
MQIMPKVSVIVPNYNHARYLPERIASILHQSFSDFELILMDDASTDTSREVIDSLAASDARIRTLINTTNSGSGYKQWNKGVGEASGEYVWIAESDDSAEAGLLKQLVDKLDKHPEVGLAYCQSWRMNERGENTGTLLEWTSDLGTDRWEKDFVADGVEECRHYLCLKNTIPNASGVVFRRGLFEKIGGTTDSLRLCADWMLWVRMLMESGLAYVAEPLNRFRMEPTSVTHQSKKDGTNAEESYRMARSIESLIGIAPEVIETAREKMFFVWTHPILRNEVTIPRERNLRIYREASAFDPHLHRRLLMFFARYTVVKNPWIRRVLRRGNA